MMPPRKQAAPDLSYYHDEHPVAGVLGSFWRFELPSDRVWGSQGRDKTRDRAKAPV